MLKCLDCGKDVTDLIYPAGHIVAVYIPTMQVLPYCLECLEKIPLSIDDHDSEIIYDDGWRG